MITMKKKTYLAPVTEAITLFIEDKLLTDPSSSFKSDEKEDVDFSDKSNNKTWNSHIWSSMDNAE